MIKKQHLQIITWAWFIFVAIVLVKFPDVEPQGFWSSIFWGVTYLGVGYALYELILWTYRKFW